MPHASWMIASLIDEHITLGDLVVGLGTIALAAFTATLARATSESVVLNRQDLALTRQGLEAADMPFVIAMQVPEKATQGMTPGIFHLRPGREADVLTIRLRLQNLGKGPAIVSAVELAYGHDSGLMWGLASDIPIPADQCSDIEMALSEAGLRRAREHFADLRSPLSWLHRRSSDDFVASTEEVNQNRDPSILTPGVSPGGETEPVLRILYTHASGSPYATTSRVRIDEDSIECLSFARTPERSRGPTRHTGRYGLSPK